MNVSDEIVKKLSESPTGAQWQKIGIKHHHGINVPLFSLHSDKSCGIGEFPDLLPLIPWCKDLGLTVIQLLPLNDSGIDASPYSAISACALNPIYLGLASLPHLEAFPQSNDSARDWVAKPCRNYIAPPSTVKMLPTAKDACWEQRNATTVAISIGSPNLPIARCSAKKRSITAGFSLSILA